MRISNSSKWLYSQTYTTPVKVTILVKVTVLVKVTTLVKVTVLVKVTTLAEFSLFQHYINCVMVF